MSTRGPTRTAQTPALTPAALKLKTMPAQGKGSRTAGFPDCAGTISSGGDSSTFGTHYLSCAGAADTSGSREDCSPFGQDHDSSSGIDICAGTSKIYTATSARSCQDKGSQRYQEQRCSSLY
jgi:hypothetical protein